MLARVQQAARALDPDQRLAGMAAGAMLLTLFLPWYQVSVARGNAFVEDSRSAFEVFSFVEAAILLVALGVFALLFARGERRAFHLPGGDGTVVLAAGAWAALLLVWRLFDKPDVGGRGTTVGITWGFFFAFLAAAALAGAGWRIRQAHRPEPPNPAAEEPPRTVATRVMPRDDTAATRQLTLDDEPDEPLQPGEIPRAPRPR